MRYILIVILFFTSCVSAVAQIDAPFVKGYTIQGESVYHNSRVNFSTAKKLSKKALRARAKADRKDKGTLIPLADAKTFNALSTLYGVDCNNVFYRCDIIEGADPATFTVVEFPIDFWSSGYMQSFYYKDKTHVYHLGKVLKGADVATFRYATNQYALDKNRVYSYGDTLGIALDEYTIIGGHYIVGSENVYWGEKLLVGVRPDSFRLLKEGYATDGNIVIFEGKPMDADAPTFRRLFSEERDYKNPYRYNFYTDKNRIYHRGEPIEVVFLGKNYLVYDGNVFYRTNKIRYADDYVDSFVSLNDYWGKDRHRVYYQGDPVNANVDSFESLNNYWGKDKSLVFYQGETVSFADPATFKTVDEWEHLGFDQKFFFKEGKRLSNIDGLSFRHCQEYLYVDDNYAYVISDSSAYKMPVDGKTFEKIGCNSGKTVYEDKDNVYDYFKGEFRKLISKKYK